MKFEKVNPATGAAEPGYSRDNSSKIQVNQHTGTMNEGKLINKGRGPTVGNKSDKDSTYPKVNSMPKVTPGKEMFMGSSNPQVRTPGGTREWDPKHGQNFEGNADSINVGRGPTKGNQR